MEEDTRRGAHAEAVEARGAGEGEEDGRLDVTHLWGPEDARERISGGCESIVNKIVLQYQSSIGQITQLSSWMWCACESSPAMSANVVAGRFTNASPGLLFHHLRDIGSHFLELWGAFFRHLTTRSSTYALT